MPAILNNVVIIINIAIIISKVKIIMHIRILNSQLNTFAFHYQSFMKKEALMQKSVENKIFLINDVMMYFQKLVTKYKIVFLNNLNSLLLIY